MANLDRSSDYGKRALQRLHDEKTIWLTTVAKDGSPFPKPVWFWWDGETILIYCQPTALALKHIARSARVSLNLDSNSGTGGVVALTGTATSAAAAVHNDAFMAKYADMLPTLLENYGEDFTTLYTVSIRIEPDRVMGH